MCLNLFERYYRLNRPFENGGSFTATLIPIALLINLFQHKLSLMLRCLCLLNMQTFGNKYTPNFPQNLKTKSTVAPGLSLASV